MWRILEQNDRYLIPLCLENTFVLRWTATAVPTVPTVGLYEATTALHIPNHIYCCEMEKSHLSRHCLGSRLEKIID